MIEKLAKGFSIFCIATVLTQMIFFAFFLMRGTINRDTGIRLVAMLNGIDISGNLLREIMTPPDDNEQPDIEEILEARKMESLEMDMRLRSQAKFSEELAGMLAELQEQREFFDERRIAFTEKLAEMERGARDEGVQQVQRTLQTIEAEHAKDQLLRIYDDERVDEVVNIIQAMPTDKRRDILNEFVTQEERDKLAEILRRIGEGGPTTSLIKQANGG